MFNRMRVISFPWHATSDAYISFVHTYHFDSHAHTYQHMFWRTAIDILTRSYMFRITTSPTVMNNIHYILTYVGRALYIRTGITNNHALLVLDTTASRHILFDCFTILHRVSVHAYALHDTRTCHICFVLPCIYIYCIQH